MKYLLPLFAFLASCTNPEFVTLKTKQGEHIHTISKEPFFNSPDKTSEWLFWYTPIVLVFLWLMWKEIKGIWMKKSIKQEDNESTVSRASKPTNSV